MTSDHAPSARNSGPLAGLTVVDLSQVVSGAVASMLLADFGADVIKIEPPVGESYRNSGYPLGTPDDQTNLNILRWTRGKRSVTVDLKSPSGLKVLKALIERADVLVENFRPGVMTRLGLGAEDLRAVNPSLIYTSVSGFGHDDLYDSPYRDRPAYAIIAEAMGGLMHLAGDGQGTPVWMGFAMADIFSGVLAFSGTILALYDRPNWPADKGRRVDVAMYDSSVFMNDLAVAMQTMTGTTMGGGQYTLQSPWGPFEASNGFVVVAVLTERQWAATCEVIGRPDLATDARLSSGRARSQYHHEVVEPAITAWSLGRTKEECTDLLLAANVPAAPVNTSADIVHCPSVKARNMLVDVQAPGVGTATVVGNPIKLDGDNVDGAARRIPRLGEDTAAVLRDYLNMDQAEIDRLVDQGAIGAKRN